MDKEKIYSLLSWVIIVMILILQIYGMLNKQKVPEQIYTDGKWNYGFICSQYKFYKQIDADKGWNCQLDYCKTIQDNPKVEECTCLLNNLSVNRICVSQFYVRNYDWLTYNKAQQVNRINSTGGN